MDGKVKPTTRPGGYEGRKDSTMERYEIMERLAAWFNIEPDENGEWDINDYDWQAGCYMNHAWFSLSEVVKALED